MFKKWSKYVKKLKKLEEECFFNVLSLFEKIFFLKFFRFFHFFIFFQNLEDSGKRWGAVKA